MNLVAQLTFHKPGLIAPFRDQHFADDVHVAVAVVPTRQKYPKVVIYVESQAELTSRTTVVKFDFIQSVGKFWLQAENCGNTPDFRTLYKAEHRFAGRMSNSLQFCRILDLVDILGHHSQ